MTGLDCLRDEMKKRGLGDSQIKSKTAAVVLDILSESGTVHADIVTAENKLNNLRAEINKRQGTIWRLEEQETALRKNIGDLQNEKDEIYNKKDMAAIDYIDKWYKALEECETEEGRDTMRLAQVFRNSVDVDTKYDNTAYIIGLAAILSHGKIGALEELKKINKKLPLDNIWIDVNRRRQK